MAGRRWKSKPRRERGYGAAHERLRRVWRRRINAGGECCWRCGGPIPPGSAFHLGHDDDDRGVYRGPEHPLCNLKAAGQKSQKLRRAARAPLVTSRPW